MRPDTYRPQSRDQDWSSWDRGGRGPGGKDRAYLGPPQGGRGRNPRPNQPVPPFGFPSFPRRLPPMPPRDWGPQQRSYAEVVRQANPRWGGNAGDDGFFRRPWFRQQGRFPQPMRQQRNSSVDPKFGALVRQLKKVIKIVHHLRNVTGERSPPQMISRMVDMLASVIKPAAPNAKTADMILGNAKNWGHTTMVILQDHYETALHETLGGLVLDTDVDWKVAFDVATRWARRNLPRLPRDVVEHAEALVAATMGPDGNPQTGGATGSTNTGPQQGDGPIERNEPTRGTLSRRHTQEGPSQVAFVEEVVTAHQQSTRTNGEQGEQGATRRQEDGPNEVNFWDQIVTESSSLRDAPPRPLRDRRVRGRDPSVDKSRAEEPLVLLPAGVVTVDAQVHRDPQGDSVEAVDLLDFDSVLEEPSGVSTPQPNKFAPTRHIRTDRKMVDWTVSVSKKWLFIGDSNLSRLPHHGFADLQIDSFPGATFRHLGAVLLKAVVQVRVEKVLISCGLNSRGQKFKETTLKQVQTAIRMVKRRFPYAEIWVPLLNYSTALPESEQRNLIALNGHIFRNLPFVSPLPADEFQTERDNVHWTKDTARAMFDHWSAALNFPAP